MAICMATWRHYIKDEDMEGIVTERIAVVTGGGSGIGAAAALALAGEGVDGSSRRTPREAALREVVAAHPGPLVLDPIAADITDEESVRALFATKAVQRHGRFDLLLDNAGIGGPPPGARRDPASRVEGRGRPQPDRGLPLDERKPKGSCRYSSPPGGRIINDGSISAYPRRPRSLAATRLRSTPSPG